MQTDCVILGGGAAGLCAAAALGRSGLRVTLLEKLPRVGKKLLATGNGRCNLSNTDMQPAYYGDSAPFVRKVYEATPPQEVSDFFTSLGLMTAAEDGRIYPRTMAASSVLDVLRMACERYGIQMMTDCEVIGFTPSRRGGWSVQLADGSGIFSPYVLDAMGGSAAPAMGTDGSGVRLLAQLGHEATPLYPALVQLKCSHPALKGLKGIRVQAHLTLFIEGNAAAQETGELLFADYGVSGVCVFQLSRFVAPALQAGQAVCLSVNFFPEIEEIHAWMNARIHMLPSVSALEWTTGILPRLLAQTLLKEAGILPDARMEQQTQAELESLCRALSDFRLNVIGTQGFANAQVTHGGIVLRDVSPETMQSRLFDGLYLTGELLDVDGPCGGYNLHFAFASALTAAKAIAGGRL